MSRFDSAAADLVPGQIVRVRVVSHEPWGVAVALLDYPDVNASVDAGLIDSVAGAPRALPQEYPPVGAEIDAVVQRVDREGPPVWVRLTLRAADREVFGWPCGICARSTVLSAGGDGVVLDVRSADGPGGTSIVAHRSCVIACLHATADGERARVAGVGRDGRAG